MEHLLQSANSGVFYDNEKYVVIFLNVVKLRALKFATPCSVCKKIQGVDACQGGV